jgi:HPt (histidine-containing phosphotransfer) domain-containing protein
LRDLVNRFVAPTVRDAATTVHANASANVAPSAPAAASSAPTGEFMTPAPQYTPGEVQLSVLANLVGDDETVIREFLTDFQGSARQLAVEIRVAHEAGNLAQVGALAHRLKSSARSVGALYFGEVCAELERAGKLGQEGMVGDARRRFDAELVLVDAALTRLGAGA